MIAWDYHLGNVSTQDFMIRVPILNVVGGMAGNKRFSGESGGEPRRSFKASDCLQVDKI